MLWHAGTTLACHRAHRDGVSPVRRAVPHTAVASSGISAGTWAGTAYRQASRRVRASRYSNCSKCSDSDGKAKITVERISEVSDG